MQTGLPIGQEPGSSPTRSTGLAVPAAPLPPGPVPPASGSGPPEARPPPVRVTEADRVAWMRQFLNALEQWKSFLDSLPTDAPPPALAERATEGLAHGSAAGAPPGGDPCAAYAVYAATAQAQQAQYLQQYQFWQQMRAHEAQRMGKGGPAAAPAPQLAATRFKDGFRPMRLCKHLTTMGFCRQGDQCTFAHTYEELHVSSADLPKPGEEKVLAAAFAEQGNPAANNISSDPNALPDLRLKKKKELCGRFARGYCSLGKVCSFAHGEDELNTVGLAVCGKVKTQLCRNWEAGRCIYGANCNNAHGDQEIGTKRPPPELAPPNKRRRDDEGWDGDEPPAVGEEPAGAAAAP